MVDLVNGTLNLTFSFPNSNVFFMLTHHHRFPHIIVANPQANNCAISPHREKIDLKYAFLKSPAVSRSCAYTTAGDKVGQENAT